MRQRNKTNKRKTYKRKSKRSKRISRKSRRSFIKKTRTKKSRANKSIAKKSRANKSRTNKSMAKKSRAKKYRKRMVGGVIYKKRYVVTKPDKLYLYGRSRGGAAFRPVEGYTGEINEGDEIITGETSTQIYSGQHYLTVYSLNGNTPGTRGTPQLYCNSNSLRPPKFKYEEVEVVSIEDFCEKARLSNEIISILKREEIELNELEFINMNRFFKNKNQRKDLSEALSKLKPVTEVMKTHPEHVAPLETLNVGGSVEVKSEKERLTEALNNSMKPAVDGGHGLSSDDIKKYWKVVRQNNGGIMIPGPEMIHAILEEYYNDKGEGSETLLRPEYQLMRRNSDINIETARELMRAANGDVDMALQLYNSDAQARASGRDLQSRAAPRSSATPDEQEELDLYSTPE